MENEEIHKIIRKELIRINDLIAKELEQLDNRIKGLLK